MDLSNPTDIFKPLLHMQLSWKITDMKCKITEKVTKIYVGRFFCVTHLNFEFLIGEKQFFNPFGDGCIVTAG